MDYFVSRNPMDQPLGNGVNISARLMEIYESGDVTLQGLNKVIRLLIDLGHNIKKTAR
jgi:hypothetical protein